MCLMNSYPLLIEIGCENLPPSDIKIIRDTGAEIFSGILKNYRIEHSRVKIMVSVRRAAVKVNKAASHQNSVFEVKKGPPALVAVKDGRPTKAGLGFAKGMGVDFNDLVKKETPKGEYYFCEKKISGGAVRDILPEITNEFIKGLEFPITMRWPGAPVRFPRPIRWLLVKFGRQAVKFKFGNLSAGRSSRGHYIFADRKIYIDKIKDYKKILKRNYVYADSAERLRCLKNAVERPLRYTKGYPMQKDELLEEINNSVEFPTGIKGKFPEKYLRMPREIIEACLVHHQKYFPVEDKAGNLLNYFVGVRDGISEHLETIRKGYRKVLIARLEDAEFFLNKDRKKALNDYVKLLDGVQFSRGLGTLYDKTERLRDLSEYLARRLNKDKTFIRKSVRAATLAKADLVSYIVEEFPELEGTAGSIYAALDGEDKDVALSVREHYYPVNPAGDIPRQEIAAVVGAVDRIDTVCGNIGTGVEATGSADPFGLRRLVKGLINIMAGFNWDIDIEDIVKESLKVYKKQGIKLKKKHTEKIRGFIGKQVENYLGINFKYDVVRCVMAGERLNPGLLAVKAEAVADIKTSDGFDSIITAFKRIKNILKQAGEKGIKIPIKYDGRKLKDDREKKLSKEYRTVSKEVEKLLAAGGYKKVLVKLASMRKSIDKYFDEVMVMVEDKDLRANRLAMLKNIFELFAPAGDISELEFLPELVPELVPEKTSENVSGNASGKK